MVSYKKVLEHLPFDALQKMFDRTHPHLRRSRRSKEKIVNILGNKYREPKFVRSLIELLSLEDKELLKHILLTNAEEIDVDGVNFGILKKKELFISKNDIIISANKLADIGLIFIFEQRTSLYYYIPDDLKKVLEVLFKLDLSERIKYSDAPEYIRWDGYSLIHDILSFLTYVNKNKVKITQAGYIYKKNLHVIYSRFIVEDKDEFGFGSEQGYRDRMEFILSYIDFKGLTTKVNHTLVVTENIKDWLKMNDLDIFKDVYEFWKKHYIDYFGMLSSTAVMDIIRDLQLNSWVSYKSIEPMIKRKLRTYVTEEYLWRELKFFILNPLTFMSIIATNNAKDPNEFLFSLTQLGHTIIELNATEDIEPRVDRFFIQPNFELLAPQNLSIELRWKLEEIANLKQMDKMMIYELSKDSVIHALRQGWTKDEVLDFLTFYSKMELPQNVRQSIEDWTARYGRAYLLDVFLLRCEDEAMARELKASKKIGRYILGELNPKDLIIEKGNAKALLKELDYIGYPTFPGYIRYTGRGEEKVKFYGK